MKKIIWAAPFYLMGYGIVLFNFGWKLVLAIVLIEMGHNMERHILGK